MNNGFINYLENQLEIKNLLKVEDITFSILFNRLEISLYYNEAKKDLFETKKEDIENCIKKYIDNDNIPINIVYKKSFLDDNYLKVMIRRFLNDSNITILKNINQNKIDVNKDGDIYIINIPISTNKSFESIYNALFEKMIDEFKRIYFYKFEIKYIFVEFKQEKYELDRDYVEIDPETVVEEIVEIRDLIQYYGDIIQVEPVNLGLINSSMKYIAICGKCYYFSKKEYKREKKIKNSNKTEMIDVYRYTFKVRYKDESITCNIFPKKQDLDREFNIEDGTEICVDGEISEYNGHLSLKVKNINFCSIIKDCDKEKIYREIDDKYHKILPERLVVDEQSDIFSMMEEKEVKDIIKNKDYVVFDLETTGLNCDTDNIIEIAAIKIVKGKMCESFNTFVCPPKMISEKITELTNITNEMVKDAPRDYEIIGDFLKFSQGCVLVAYNAPFDMGFLNKLAYKCNYLIDNEIDDALVLAKQKIKKIHNYKLQTVAEYLKVDLIGAHRAINDTLATAKVYLKLLDMD